MGSTQATLIFSFVALLRLLSFKTNHLRGVDATESESLPPGAFPTCNNNDTKVTKIVHRPCTRNFQYCIPGVGAADAACPGKLVYNPKRERCDLRKYCNDATESGKDVECLSLPCGIYPATDCKKYFICSGGVKIWKKCPGDTFFDKTILDCTKTGNCDFQPGATPMDPIDVAIVDPNPVDASNQAMCPFHEFPLTDERVEEIPDGLLLDSKPVTNWGKWEEWVYCPKDHFITSLSIYKRSTEDSKGNFDHAGVVSIGFKCENMVAKKKTTQIIGQCAKGAPDKVWKFWMECERGAAVGFQLAQLPAQGKDGDDVATDNFKMICSCGVDKEVFRPYHERIPKYEKVGYQMGNWTDKMYCREKQALCGFRAQFHPWVKEQVVDLAKSDMTGMNQMKFKCCNVENPALLCEPKSVRKYLATCDNLEGEKARPCKIKTFVGSVFTSKNGTRGTSFYTSIGYTMKETLPQLQERFSQLLPDCSKGGSSYCVTEWLKGSSLDPTRMFQPAHSENTMVDIPVGTVMNLYQTIVICGFYEVHTNQIIKETNTTKPGVPEPEPSTHLWEGSLSHWARRKRLDKVTKLL